MTDLYDSCLSHQVLNCGKTLNKSKIIKGLWYRNSLQQFAVFCCEMEVTSFLRKSRYQTRWQLIKINEENRVVLMWIHPVLFLSRPLISGSDMRFHCLHWGVTCSHCEGSRWRIRPNSFFYSVVFNRCEDKTKQNMYSFLSGDKDLFLIRNSTSSCCQ